MLRNFLNIIKTCRLNQMEFQDKILQFKKVNLNEQNITQ